MFIINCSIAVTWIVLFNQGYFILWFIQMTLKYKIDKKKTKYGNQSNNVETALSPNILLKTGEGKHRGSQIYAIW